MHGHRNAFCRYQKIKKRNNYTVQVCDGSYGEVQFYITVFLADQETQDLEIVKPYTVTSSSASIVPHAALLLQQELNTAIVPVEKSPPGTLKVVALTDLFRICIPIEFEDYFYICAPPNQSEKD